MKLHLELRWNLKWYPNNWGSKKQDECMGPLVRTVNSKYMASKLQLLFRVSALGFRSFNHVHIFRHVVANCNAPVSWSIRMDFWHGLLYLATCNPKMLPLPNPKYFHLIFQAQSIFSLSQNYERKLPSNVNLRWKRFLVVLLFVANHGMSASSIENSYSDPKFQVLASSNSISSFKSSAIWKL